jgi:enoyl-CoA hydratase
MTLHVEHRGRVTVLTLDRPERRNAVDHSTLLELLEAQAELTARIPAATRCVVLTGSPPAFSAGADLHGVEEGRFTTDLGLVLRGFGDLAAPVIAAVDGPALGAGTQLVVAADLRVATPDSTFGIPAAKLGLVVDHWTIRRLAAEFSAPIAREMLVTAGTSTAVRLHGIGAIHRLGGLGDALGWAEEISALAPLTIAAHKLGLRGAGRDAPLDERFEAARAVAWSSADAEEGRTAFLAKRDPEFHGR